MKAAIVSAFNRAPRFGEYPTPRATDPDEIVIDVLAAGLHPRVLSQADGSHYTSTDELPLVPGIDGVGRDADGRLRYFILPDTTMGSMAEKTVIDSRRSIVLPEGSDAVAVAAVMNPAMSSWVALRRRISFTAGMNVLVLGATGNAGAMAIQVAKTFDADKIVAAGRNPERLAALPALGATDAVSLDGDPESVAERLVQSAADVDVVIDYLWGAPTAAAMTAIIPARADRSRPLRWVQIGSMAGATSPIPSAALRAARLQIVGSGQGSVSNADILAELPALVDEIDKGTFVVDTRPMPLSNVEQAWSDAATATRRIVLTPSAAGGGEAVRR